ncbi:glycosyltransferase family 4 protein [Puia sp. P3]|uniref:glycosyltransferase family 4 protein n=1 Tax=Puia sp. P3 TaxID=3423952 RepID=UPI003D66DE8D
MTKLASSYIEVKGYVSDEELVKLYQNTKMVVIPLRYGAGVKGKTVEAMYHGIPFVTSRFGIEGLQNIKDVTTSNDSADQFATAILGLYNDAGKLQDFSRREIEYSRKYFSEDNVNDLILRTFS